MSNQTQEKELIRVEKIEGKKWHGKEGADSFAQPITLEVLYSEETGRYATGLTEEEAESYGKQLGVDLSDTFVIEKPHPYWNSRAGIIKLNATSTFFNPNKLSDLIKIKNLKAHSMVANSLEDYEAGLYPDAKFYIVDETDEVKKKATKAQQKQKAFSLLAKMSAEDKISIIQILSKQSYKNQSNDFIDAEIDLIIEKNTEDFIRYAKMDSAEVYIRAAIYECLQKNILTKEGNSILYMGDTIAFDYEEAVQWFKNPQNQKMKVSIFDKMSR